MPIPFWLLWGEEDGTPATIALSASVTSPIGASHNQSRDLTILVFKPDISSYTPRGTFVDAITGRIDTYTHTINALGGYWQATFTINDRQDRIEDWIAEGLGRHIEVYDDALVKIWEGFVNEPPAALGSLAVRRGPLLNVTNRADLVYSTVDTTISPPAVGVRERVGQSDDTDSQALYGILETILSSGGATATEAEEALNSYLEQRKDPRTSKDLTIGSVTNPSVTVNCLGYVHLLTKYAYNQTTNTGEIDLSTKIENVISDDPNGIFDTNFLRIDSNPLQVKRWEDDDKKAWDIIKYLVSLGDIQDDRYLFGIYNDFEPVYEIAPSDIEYYLRLCDPEQRIETATGQRVLPWNVLPGKWLLNSDLLVGQAVPDSLRDDPRVMFIESVTYTAPWGLQVKGGDTDELPQKLAKMGLGGIGS